MRKKEELHPGLDRDVNKVSSVKAKVIHVQSQGQGNVTKANADSATEGLHKSQPKNTFLFCYLFVFEFSDFKSISSEIIYTVLKNDTALACYNFDLHQPILIIFGRNVAKKV